MTGDMRREYLRAMGNTSSRKASVMARTKTTPGPKRCHGARRDYHILLSSEMHNGERMALSDAYERVAAIHGGVIAYTAMIVRERPEILALLQGEDSNGQSSLA